MYYVYRCRPGDGNHIRASDMELSTKSDDLLIGLSVAAQWGKALCRFLSKVV